MTKSDVGEFDGTRVKWIVCGKYVYVPGLI